MTAKGVSSCKNCGRRIVIVSFSWGSMWMHRKLISDDNYYEACPRLMGPPKAGQIGIVEPFTRATPIEEDQYHGRPATYCNYECRCPECTEARAEDAARRKAVAQ